MPAKGWKGGFVAQHPEMKYPKVNLDALCLTDNMDNIQKITRQQRVLWPEFTWETEQGKKDPKRCFQMFAPDISRIGYDDIGQSWSIICPQQGTFIEGLGTINVEVTVTSQKGWVDESNKTLAADMTIKPKIWFSPSAKQSPLGALIWNLIDLTGLPFPTEKSKAIEINAFQTAQEKQSILAIRDGLFLEKDIPGFANHSKVSWNHANVEVAIGPIDVNPDPTVAGFNDLVMKLFNLGSANMLQEGNILAWNVWVDAPSLVDQTEWSTHAERWRKSIDVDHCSPDGPETKPRFSDGSYLDIKKELTDEAIAELLAYVKSHL